MNKRYLLISGLLVLGVTASVCGFTACGPGKPAEEVVPEITERVRYTEKTNPYAELTWQEFAEVDDWADKLENAPIYYQFDGSYAEAYHGDNSRDYVYINCYEDGSLFAELRENGQNKNLYGYWTNITSRNKESLVLTVVNYAGHQYGGSEIVCSEISGSYYDFESNITIEKNGGRTVPLSGLRYSPIKSLTVTTSPLSAGCIVGDPMSYSGLVVTVNRENGKSIDIDKESYTDPSCRVKFSGFDSSEAGDNEVTVSYVHTDVTAKYTVKVMGVKSIAVDASKAVKEYIEGDKYSSEGLIVNATRDDDQVVGLDLSKCKVETPEEWGTPGDQTITVKYGDLTAEYKVKIFGVKEITVDASTVVKEYKIGDDLNTEGLAVSATRDDDEVVDLDLTKCKIETPEDWGTPGEKTITVKFGELSKTYTVTMEAPTYTGTVNGKSVTLKVNSLSECEYTYEGTKYELNYVKVNLYGYDTTVYNFVKPEGATIDEATWNTLAMRFVLDKENGTVAKHLVYEIPATDSNGQDLKDENGENLRKKNEIYDPGGNSEMRFIVFDEENQTVTVSYKYWYHGTKDTFVCKYTLEDGILTFTEEVSSKVDGGGATFAKIHKVWQLHDDYTATRVDPEPAA